MKIKDSTSKALLVVLIVGLLADWWAVSMIALVAILMHESD